VGGSILGEHTNSIFSAEDRQIGKAAGFTYVCIVTDFLEAFLGNGSANMFQRATVEDVSQWTNVMARC
jgi:hypothetical protein